MRILKTSLSTPAEIVAEATNVLRQGGLVLFPTETTYGAGVDATNPEAVQKLLAYKSRREGKPLSIAVTDQKMAEKYVVISEAAAKLYRTFLPGPVTVISQSLGNVAPGVESEFGTLGVRIPDYPLVTALVEKLGVPITATSANGSGEKRPYTVADILQGLSATQTGLIDLIIDAGQLPERPPSTVIDTTLSTPVTFRQGELSLSSAGQTDSQYSLFSQSEDETRKIASRLLLKYWSELKSTGLVIGLDGALGVGKTIFAKGAAEFLLITEDITSPTYTYNEEYNFSRHGVNGQLYHLDLWKINSEKELQNLEISSLLKPNTVVVIEWYSQVSQWLQPEIKAKNIPLITIEITQKDQARELTIHE